MPRVVIIKIVMAFFLIASAYVVGDDFLPGSDTSKRIDGYGTGLRDGFNAKEGSKQPPVTKAPSVPDVPRATVGMNGAAVNASADPLNPTAIAGLNAASQNAQAAYQRFKDDVASNKYDNSDAPALMALFAAMLRPFPVQPSGSNSSGGQPSGNGSSNSNTPSTPYLLAAPTPPTTSSAPKASSDMGGLKVTGQTSMVDSSGKTIPIPIVSGVPAPDPGQSAQPAPKPAINVLAYHDPRFEGLDSLVKNNNAKGSGSSFNYNEKALRGPRGAMVVSAQQPNLSELAKAMVKLAATKEKAKKDTEKDAAKKKEGPAEEQAAESTTIPVLFAGDTVADNGPALAAPPEGGFAEADNDARIFPHGARPNLRLLRKLASAPVQMFQAAEPVLKEHVAPLLGIIGLLSALLGYVAYRKHKQRAFRKKALRLNVDRGSKNRFRVLPLHSRQRRSQKRK